MLGPHHGVHGELCRGRASAEDLADAEVLVLFQAEFRPGLLEIGCGQGIGDGVVDDCDGLCVGHCGATSVRVLGGDGADGGQEQLQTVERRAGEGLHGVLGVRHEADGPAVGGGDAGDGVH